MRERISRREVLATTAAASLSLAGCIQSTAKQGWKNDDAYPDDEARNRECEIRSSGTTSGVIEPAPSKLGYAPFIYTFSGRGDMHGTNQHYELTVSADSDIKIIGVSSDDVANSVVDGDSSSLNLPKDSEIVENQTLTTGETYQETWRIPDGETYSVLFAPDGQLEGPISVEMDLGCSYYLPLDEYKERTG